MPLPPHTRRLTIIAQDPSVEENGQILRAQVEVPAEELGPGPCGYRVQVIDYDSTAQLLYKPPDARRYRSRPDGTLPDPFEKATDRTLLKNAGFHAQNVYAIVMRILARFEFALGRRVSWSFETHQLKVAPHAFADANAFYSPSDEGLFFGYFRGHNGTVFTSLSHDIVAHETTHALLDGLRERFIDPSSPDQAAFHEGFADVLALLSVFSLEEVVRVVLEDGNGASRRRSGASRPTLPARRLSVSALQQSALLGLAEQMGEELSHIRGQALRQSAALKPSHAYLNQHEFFEPHRRGEILVAAMMNAFLRVWTERLKALDPTRTQLFDRDRVVEEGAKAADHLLTIAVRGLDYCMPVHIEFGDFLSALLTADYEICPGDAPYHYRDQLRESFGQFGITPTSSGCGDEAGIWLPPETEPDYRCVHFASMTRDPDEVFRFIWENREVLKVAKDVHTRVLSVRPCVRLGPDGFMLRETVAEYMQMVELEARELKKWRIPVPSGMPPGTRLILQGGGTLIFDEYGRLKFNVINRIDDAGRQSKRIEHMWQVGFIRVDGRGVWRKRRFSDLHRQRAVGSFGDHQEGWH